MYNTIWTYLEKKQFCDNKNYDEVTEKKKG